MGFIAGVKLSTLLVSCYPLFEGLNPDACQTAVKVGVDDEIYQKPSEPRSPGNQLNSSGSLNHSNGKI